MTQHVLCAKHNCNLCTTHVYTCTVLLSTISWSSLYCTVHVCNRPKNFQSSPLPVRVVSCDIARRTISFPFVILCCPSSPATFFIEKLHLCCYHLPTIFRDGKVEEPYRAQPKLQGCVFSKIRSASSSSTPQTICSAYMCCVRTAFVLSSLIL